VTPKLQRRKVYTTATIMTDPDFINSFENASFELLNHVRKAIDDFYQHPPPDWEQWENWRTPKLWQDRVIPILDRYHNNLKIAKQAFDQGDISPIVYEAASYSGISKDLEYDMSWMTEQNEIAVQQAIRNIALSANQIYRVGYELLSQQFTTRKDAIDPIMLALKLVHLRMQQTPDYGVYIHAKEQLEKMQSLLVQPNIPSLASRDFVNIGLMAAKELENSDPDLADALMLAEYNFRNVS
jgi:hypothetical protein